MTPPRKPQPRSLIALAMGALIISLPLGAWALAGEQPPRARGESAALLDKRLQGGSESLQATRPAPRGGSPLGVARSRTEDGMTCVSLGRVKNGRVVLPAPGGADIPATQAKAGLCHRVEDLADDMPVIFDTQWRFYDDETGARETTTVIYGMTKPTVSSLSIRVGERPVELPLKKGTFVLGFPAAALINGFRLEARLASGAQVVVDEPALEGSARETILDPPTGPELNDMLDPSHP